VWDVSILVSFRVTLPCSHRIITERVVDHSATIELVPEEDLESGAQTKTFGGERSLPATRIILATQVSK
jgi:hypothetical protein